MVAAREAAAALGGQGGEGTDQHLLALSRAFDAMDSVIDAQLARLEPEPVRIPCPFCKGMIMRAATRCGFCWRRQP